MLATDNIPICPHCRSLLLRRRKRDALVLIAVSWLGRWPYQCDNCGTGFFLRKRYIRPKNAEMTQLPGAVGIAHNHLSKTGD